MNTIPEPNLSLENLGRVGIAGDFTGISLYQYEGQNEQAVRTNGSETLMIQLPNGLFLDILDTDASIQAMCIINGSLIIGGNFTSLGGENAPAVAILDLDTAGVTALMESNKTAFSQVNSLLCDNDSGKVYIGGSFREGESTNAVTWVPGQGYVSLPFAGFNGPVNSISKASNGHIIFGGSFTGLGNTSTPSTPDGQVINLSTATITADGTVSSADFSSPENVVCQTGGVDGPNSTWLLQDNTPGTWRASFEFGFQPTKLRLWNTHQDGRGTKTWRFTALPLNGIMNFTYLDPVSGQNTSCTNECPLSDNKTISFQDFHFVNQVGMNEFRIDVSDWYGNGGGFDGIELFQDEIFTHAINRFNEPSCGLEFPSTATATGPWEEQASGSSSSKYLLALVSSPVTPESAAVTFFPDIRESGDYILKMYTPGCIQDNSCSTRGQVNITWDLTSQKGANNVTDAVLFQTNNFEKYDQIGVVTVDASSSSFRPSVTLAPLANQDVASLTIVAQRIGFELINTTGGLNGLFEYDPSKNTVDTEDFSTSVFDKLGSSFSSGSAVQALVTAGDVTYIGGNFTSDFARNIAAINSQDNSNVTLSGGLNGEISSLYALQDQLFVGGKFTSSQDGSATDLNNIAVYNTNTSQWAALGAGVDGHVANIVPMKLNISSNTPEDVITLTGQFQNILGFGSNSQISVQGFAVWVKSKNNWLQNLDVPVPSLSGALSASLLDLPDGSSLYAGSLTAQALGADGVVTLTSDASLGLFPVSFVAPTVSSSNITKRASLSNTTSTSGVVAGAFYESGDRNITILAGHFEAKATNGSTINNLVLIDGANDDTVTGLPSGILDESVFLALAVQGDRLFAGGQINGTIAGDTVHGIVSYSLTNQQFGVQPPALTGAMGIVSNILVRPNTADVYVGGSFDSAGSLPCPGVCYYSTSTSQWNRPGLGFDGDVNTMIWSSNSQLVAGGNLTVNGSRTFLASYDASSSSWSNFASASSLPGPVDALTLATSDGSQIWAAGTENNGSVYLMKYDGSSWQSVGDLLGSGTVISSLQNFMLTSSHDSTSLVDSDKALMITGQLNITGFGFASSGLYDGKTIRPFALTSNTANTAGSIARIFTQNSNFFKGSNGNMPIGFVVLIALAISLGLMLLIVVAGMMLDRYRKKRDGYMPAPTSMYDRGIGMRRIPPHELLESLNKGRPGAPHV